MATKRLARQLGIIRRLSKTPSSGQSHSGPKTKQLFDYLIIIDFESTCWKDARRTYRQEIIEFPAVLLNTANGEIESEFHMYVQPQEHPILSEFCTELTGIKQDQVDEGIPLHICLSQFSKWIQKIQKDKKVVFSLDCSDDAASEGKLCAFVTWSDWDLGVCLHYECKRKQLRKPDILNSWIDLRATYKLFYCRKPQGLNGALQDVGIIFAGREHSGLDDSQNTARLAWKMISDGCVLKITKSLHKAPPAKNSTARVLHAKPTNSSPLGSDAKASCADGSRNGDLTSEMENNKEVQQQEFTPAFSHGNSHVLLRNAKNFEGYSSIQSSVTSYVSSPLGCFQPFSYNNLGIQNGLKHELQISNSSVQNPGLVLVNTTLSSVNISTLDISTTPDCLAMLADWEDVALLAVSQDDQNSDSLQGETSLNGRNFLASSERMDTSNVTKAKLESEIEGATLDMVHSKSVVYKSPNTTIYNTGLSKFSNTTVFKLPSTKASVASTDVPNRKHVTSSLENHKRKPSSPKSVPPAKKPPFRVYEDKSTPLPRSSGSHQVFSGILASSANLKVPIRATEIGRVTPPLCQCGRRARRLNVSNGGPNHGKAFYSCPSGKQEAGKKGCGYFKWEHTLQKEKLAPSFPASNTRGLPGLRPSCSSSGSSQRKCLGLRPSMRT